ncbi:hypothetical protein [Halorubrum sp. CGM4_25_10-8A]|uniref:hypothetical protein n=1 Tax=Halorubrum sp. CGM4_25_10-8A TaxID=2518116 RepID=UPI0010FA30E5|nr:hypothetical protein [Halorubrum sp. CGM4_25_10-8A]TKX40347.1 hypothetical protein EXE52_06205 [Halorubrum sp. CGM4_25_10-8A]
MLTFLPIKLTGTLYGPDSYDKAANALYVFKTGEISNTLYPAPSLFSGITKLVLDTSNFWAALILGICIISPIGGVVFVNSISDYNDPKLLRLVAVISIFLPLGFGTWLSTISIYHSFFLSIPLAIISLEILYKISTQGHMRWHVLAIILLFAVAQYHPIGFLLIVGYVVSTNIQKLLSDTDENSDSKILGWIPIQNLYASIFVSIIYFLYIQIVELISGAGFSLYSMIIGVVSSSKIPTPVTCIPSQSSSITCSSLTEIGLIPLPLVLFGVTTGVVSYVNALDLSQHKKINNNTLAIDSIYLFFAAGMALVIGPLQSPLAPRFLSFATIVGVASLVLSINQVRVKKSIIEYKYLIVFVIGSLIYSSVPALFMSSVGTFFIYILISILAMVSFVVCSRIERTQLGKILFVILIIMMILIPALYPIPGINGVPNHTWHQPTHSATNWIDDYNKENPTYVTGSRHWALQRYQDPLKGISEYRGSAYTASSLVAPPQSQVVQNYLGTEGRPVSLSEVDYVISSGLLSNYVNSLWISEGRSYSKISGISNRDVEQTFPQSNRVYVASGHASIYETSNSATNQSK